MNHFAHTTEGRPALRGLPMRSAALRNQRFRSEDAIDVLMDGQVSARELITRYQRLMASPQFGPTARRSLGDQLCIELAIHLHLEEEMFYPSVREEVGDHPDLALAEVEHECLRGQVQRLLMTPPEDRSFDARVGLIATLFDMHLHRELADLYPLARQSGLDLQLLGQALAERRDQLLGMVDETGSLNFENEADDPVGRPPR